MSAAHSSAALPSTPPRAPRVAEPAYNRSASALSGPTGHFRRPDERSSPGLETEPRAVPLVALVILDGWGCAPPGPGNAVELAETPVFDRLWRTYPHATLEASGESVGLPSWPMGNSEVGHLTIGSVRLLFLDLMRVNEP